MYETIEHTADVGIRVVAPDLDTLFREAAEGLISLIVEPLAPPSGTTRRELELTGQRHDWLLFDWLNELLYVVDAERLIPSGFDVRVSKTGLVASAQVAPLDPARYSLLREVKAITYHHLRVERTADGWLAEYIVDI